MDKLLKFQISIRKKQTIFYPQISKNSTFFDVSDFEIMTSVRESMIP